jgi:hypothetical protein
MKTSIVIAVAIVNLATAGVAFAQDRREALRPGDRVSPGVRLRERD